MEFIYLLLYIMPKSASVVKSHWFYWWVFVGRYCCLCCKFTYTWIAAVTWLMHGSVNWCVSDDYDKPQSERRGFSEFADSDVNSCHRHNVNALVWSASAWPGSYQHFYRSDLSKSVISATSGTSRLGWICRCRIAEIGMSIVQWKNHYLSMPKLTVLHYARRLKQ